MASVQLCYKYDFLFIHQKVSVGVLEKAYLNLRNHRSVGALKKQLLRKFLDILYTFFLSTLADLPGIFPKSTLEQLF